MDMKCVIFNKIVFHDVARWLETWVKDDIVVVLGYHAAPAGCTIEHVRADNPGKIRDNIINVVLDYYYPGLRENLRPIVLSCEQNGIRMELISGLLKDGEEYIFYSLEDLEGKYDLGSVALGRKHDRHATLQ